MSAHGKRYDEARAAIDRERLYAPGDAVAALKTAPDAKFDETVEVHFRLGLNVRHADEQLRGTIMLPHGTGREMRVAVFAEGDKAREAQDAGADVVGSADLAARIEGGFLDFDVAIATPDQMGNVGKLGRVLGPRGLMPNPKTGTVTFDIAKAVSDAKAGKLEYRTDRGANIHLPIGKKSFGERQLLENYAAVLEEIVRAKPAAAKGRYIQGITLTTTMGPGIHVDPTRIRDVVETEGPVSPTRLAKLVAHAYGLSRVLDDRVAQINRAVPADLRRDPEEGFVWPDARDPLRWRGFRRTTGSPKERPLDDVALREIGNAMATIAEHAMGITRDELAKETYRVFGGTRVTPTARERLDRAMEVIVREGRVQVVAGVVIRHR